jgi:branched-chain amino acid transport system substrate-binding protein
MREQRVSRRTFLKATGGAAVVLAGARGSWGAEPIVIGHQCDLTGILSEPGYWHDKGARAAIEKINKEGGIAGRPLTYVVEDTETNPAAGVRKLRKLIQENKADFVIGSEHGGLAMASAPIAKETRTLYASASYTDAVTGKAGNRWVIRLTNTTLHGARAAAPWAVPNLGKTWAIIFPDYAYGHAHRDNWTAEVERQGGRVLSKIAIPVGTQDPMTYIVNMTPGCEAVYIVMNPPDLPRVLTALKDIGFKGQRLLGAGAVDAFDANQIPEITLGVWGSSMMPYELSFRDTPHLRAHREALGIDTNTREKGTGRLVDMGETWVAWEAVHLIKLAADKSGWKQKKDTPKLIEYLEGVGKLPESREFPQGELLFRGEDHQAFMDFYLHKIELKRIRTMQKLAKETVVYPPTVDLRKEAWG